MGEKRKTQSEQNIRQRQLPSSQNPTKPSMGENAKRIERRKAQNAKATGTSRQLPSAKRKTRPWQKNNENKRATAGKHPCKHPSMGEKRKTRKRTQNAKTSTKASKAPKRKNNSTPTNRNAHTLLCFELSNALQNRTKTCETRPRRQNIRCQSQKSITKHH